MTDYPTWKNPPILEAVLDIRATLPASVDVAQLTAFQQGLSDRFPTQELQNTVQFGFEAQLGQLPAVHAPVSDATGLRLQSADGHRVIQVQRSGFTFSHVGSYDSWDYFSQEAHELWRRYLAVAVPETVTRIGLRYINRIHIPMDGGSVDLKEYILTAPEVAPGLPQALHSSFMRLVLPSADNASMAHIIQVVEPDFFNSGTLPLIFDIDVFKQEVFAPASEVLWEAFGALREFKNLIFNSSITDKTRRLFQ